MRTKPSMRILAIDYGKVRIGLAISDETGVIAHSLGVVDGTSVRRAITEIGELSNRKQVQRIVVGLPKRMHGEWGERARECQSFAGRLRQTTGLPVELFDERFTTALAAQTLRQAAVPGHKAKRVIDAVAATILLQNYLDRQSRS